MAKVLKSLLALAGFVAAAMWALDPSGIYEPLIAFLAAALLLYERFSTKPNPSTLSIDGQPLAFELSIGWNESPQGGELTAWLEWRTRLTLLIGRELELKQLHEWANESHALSFKVIQADGGVGKTRLAAELAQSLLDTKRWAGGFVSLATFERAQRLSWHSNTIIVVDYPEHSPERLAHLVAAAKEGLQAANKKQKLRILLLCRSQEGINKLLSDQGAQSYVSKAMALGELAGKGNLNLLNQSLSKLEAKAPSVSEQEFQTWLDQSSLHGTALFVVALALHLSALPAESTRFLPGVQLLQALLQREQARWAKAEVGYGLPHGVVTDVLAFATLFDGLSLSAVNTKLTDAYKWQAGTLSKVHSALGEVWPLDVPTQTYPAMAPDLLAAVLLWQWQSQPTKRGVSTDANLLASLAPVDQAGSTASLQRWHMQAYDQTVRLQLGVQHDAAALSGLLHGAALSGADFAERLKRVFSTQAIWVALADLAVTTGKPKAVGSKAEIGDSQLAARAFDLNHYAVTLYASGDRPGALNASHEAVDIYKRLAKTNPTAYEPALAGNIINLASFLSQTGDRPGALKATLEALDIHRRLAKTNPAVYEPYLAGSINNLANRLRENGDRPGALQAGQEAVDIRMHLVKTNPAAYEPDLAMSITNLANFLRDTGDRQGALKAALEALDIRRRLAKTNPANYEPDLAMSINNLARFLSETGDRPGALKAGQEAVDMRRRLAKTNPANYEPDLAMSISNLAHFLNETGDRPGALKAGQEAVDIRRRLAKINPAAYEPDLAGSINNMASFLKETGDCLGALKAAQEAVDIYRRLVKTNPIAYEPDLAGSINNLANCLSEAGNRSTALKAAQEAVALYEKANQQTPGAFDQQLAIARRVLDGLS